jgi:hypothetical protein
LGVPQNQWGGLDITWSDAWYMAEEFMFLYCN